MKYFILFIPALFYITLIGICYLLIVIKKQKSSFIEYSRQKGVKNGFVLSAKYLYKKDKTVFITICIVLLIAVTIITLILSNNFGSTYYDVKGNEYSKASDIIYYDKNNISYKIDANDYSLKNTKTGESLNTSYLDKNGVVITTVPQIYLSGRFGIYYDKQKKELYFDASHIYWSKDGIMYYYDGRSSMPVSDIKYENVVSK